MQFYVLRTPMICPFILLCVAGACHLRVQGERKWEATKKIALCHEGSLQTFFSRGRSVAGSGMTPDLVHSAQWSFRLDRAQRNSYIESRILQANEMHLFYEN